MHCLHALLPIERFVNSSACSGMKSYVPEQALSHWITSESGRQEEHSCSENGPPQRGISMASCSGQELESNESKGFKRTAICIAILSQDTNYLLNCLHRGEDPHRLDTDRSTYLHLLISVSHQACESVMMPMVYMLSNAGVDVNAVDNKGNTALDVAIQKELVDTMAALVRIGLDPTTKDYKQIIRNQGSPFEFEMLGVLEKYDPGLWAAVAQNNTSLVHMLINSWCRLNIHKNQITLLEFARGTNKSAELCDLIDDYQVSLEFVHATLAGDEKRMLEFLMDSKPCDPSMMDISYQERWCAPLQPRSLRDTAIAMGHTHVLQLLPEDDDTSAHITSHIPSISTSTEDSQSTDSNASQEIVIVSARRKEPVESNVNNSGTHSDAWKEFAFHPNSYLQMPPNNLIIGGKSLAGRILHYKVDDDKAKGSPPLSEKNKSIRSKLCVIS